MTQRVLVVDDDQSTCELIQTILLAADTQSLALTNSGHAVELLRKQKFDAIFVDVNMPAPDGLEVTRQVRISKYNQKTPVVMITGDDDPSVLSRGFEAGVNFFLYKPIIKDRLLNLARVTQSVNQLERRRFQRVAVHCKIEVQFKDDVLQGETVDVSLNGVLVRAARSFPLGSAVNVRLVLAPGEKPLAAKGTVARVPVADRMGIQLEGVGKDESKRLQEFLLPLMLATTNP